MLLDIGLLIIGGIGLYFGAEWLVRGAAGLALRLGMSPLVIGLTVVSYGTSAPELAVSMLAALDDKPIIAMGNVVGSNVANIGLILGMTALIAPPRSDGSMLRRELPILLLATAALPLALIDGSIQRWEAALFLVGAIGFTWITLRWSARTGKPPDEIEGISEADGTSTLALVGLFVLGLAVLLLGGRAFVSGAVGLAMHAGLSERVVGLTVVAIGTSLPELAASIVAAAKGHSEIALGNVVGSNIFNIFLILGATGLVVAIPGDLAAMRFDLTVMGTLTLLAFASLSRARHVSRIEGTLYSATYVGFLIVLVGG